MKYLVCDAEKAATAGMNLTGRLRTKDGKLVMLNESGVMNCTGLEGTLEERAAKLEGTVMEDGEAVGYAKEKGMGI